MRKSRAPRSPFALLAPLVFAMSLAACQLFWTAPGDTLAKSAEQRAVWGMMGHLPVVDTRHVRTEGNTLVEVWVADRDGTRLEFDVRLTRLPGGMTRCEVTER